MNKMEQNPLSLARGFRKVQKAQPRAARIQHRHLQSRIVRTPCIDCTSLEEHTHAVILTSCCAITPIWHHGSIFSCQDPACRFPESSHGHHRLSRTPLRCKNVPVPQYKYQEISRSATEVSSIYFSPNGRWPKMCW